LGTFASLLSQFAPLAATAFHVLGSLPLRFRIGQLVSIGALPAECQQIYAACVSFQKLAMPATVRLLPVASPVSASAVVPPFRQPAA